MDRFSRALLMLGFALGAMSGTGCTRSPQSIELVPETLTNTKPSPNPGEGHLNPHITILTWREYVDPEVIAAFTSSTGIEVIYESFADSDETEAMVREAPGAHDLIIFDHENVELFRELCLLHPLDHSKLSHLGNLSPKHTDQDFDPGNRYSVPYLWGTTLIAYRKDKIPDPKKSWELLWDPAHKGHIAMLDERSETIGAALLKNGHSVNDRGSAALAKAESDLLSQVRDLDVRFIEGVPSILRQAFDDGVWAAMAYNGDAIALAEEDNNIGYFVPQEGCALWSDLMVITRDSRHIDEAHAFINHLLTAEAAAKSARSMLYATPNEAALKLLDEDFLANPGIFPPPDVLRRAEIRGSMTLNRERPLNDIWRKVLTLHEMEASPAMDSAEAPAQSTITASQSE